MGKSLSIIAITIQVYNINGYQYSDIQNTQNDDPFELPPLLEHLRPYFRRRKKPLLPPSELAKINEQIFSRQLLMHQPVLDAQYLLGLAVKGSSEDKVLGMLFGSAFGDAAGAPLEFWFDYQFDPTFGGTRNFPLEPNEDGSSGTSRYIGDKLYQVIETEDAQKNYEDAVTEAMQMQGGGWNRFKPGTTTDDTAMSLQMARGLLTLDKGDGDSVSIKEVQSRILASYRLWANPNPGQENKIGDDVIRNRPFDIGKTTREILRDSRIEDVDEILRFTAAKNQKAAKDFGNGMWSNGALMRIYPLAIYCLNLEKDDDVYKVVAADMALTNNNRMVSTVSTTWVLIARQMIKGNQPLKAIEYATKWLTERQISDTDDTMGYKDWQKKADQVSKKPSTVVLEWMDNAKSNPKRCDAPPQFTIQTGFEQSIFYLYQTAAQSVEFEAAIKNILLEKGDTDTNAAIVGGMLGAHYGIHGLLGFEGVSEKIEKILQCSVEPHPKPLRPDPDFPYLKFVDADHNPYLAKHYILDNIWKRLIESAPKSVTDLPASKL